jgi:capsular exopolysaccharide synthesis family protein
MGHMEQVLRRAGIKGVDALGTEPVSDFPARSVAAHDVPRIEPAPTLLQPRRPAVTRSAPAVDGLLVGSEGMSRAAIEQYRALAVTLHRARDGRGRSAVGITSALASEGKTLTCANLALTLADSYRQKVLLVDFDLRRPRLHEVFDVPPALTSAVCIALSHGASAAVPLHQVAPGVTLLGAGAAESDPTPLLASSTLPDLIKSWTAEYDWVLIDTPPVALFPDVALLAAPVGNWIVVIGAAKTPFARVQHTVETIGRERIAGVVLNRAADEALPAGEYDRYYKNYGD